MASKKKTGGGASRRQIPVSVWHAAPHNASVSQSMYEGMSDEANDVTAPALGTAAHDCEAANAEPSASKISFSCSPLALYEENTGQGDF